MYRVTEAKYIEDYKVYLRFNDGLEGVADLKDRVGRGGVFGPLEDIEFFKTLKVDPETDTIAWSNGADLAPEFLRSRIEGRS